MLRAATWAAVSSTRQAQDDKISLDLQKQTCTNKAADLGADVIEALVVPGKSRSIVLFEDACKIDAYAKLRKLVEDKAIDLLIFYEKSRLGRTIALCETITAFCHAHDVAIYDCSAPPSSLDAQKQSRSAGDSLNGIVNSWRAQTEVKLRLDKFDSAIRERIKRGERPTGQAPYGYETRFKPDGKKIIIVNEDEAATVRKLFDLYLSGWGHVEISRELNNNGHRTRTPRNNGRNYNDGRPREIRKTPAWTKGAVRSVINKVWQYAGFTEIVAHSLRERGNHQAIISEETAQRVYDERIARNKARRTVSSPYLFSRVCQCGICGKPMHVEATHYKEPIIRCKPCGRRVAFSVVRQAFIDWFTQEWRGQYAIPTTNEDNQSEVSSLESELAKMEASRQRYNRAYGDDVMSYDDYKEEMERIRNRERDLTEQLNNERHRTITHRNREIKLEQIEELSEIGLAMLEHDDPVATNVWLREFFQVVIDGEGRPKVIFK